VWLNGKAPNVPLSLIPRLIDFNYNSGASARQKRMTMTFKIKWALPPEGETLCRTCRHAHIQRGFRESEEAILCGFGSPLRPVLFKVAECTDFADRCVPERWEMERMALLINVPRAHANRLSLRHWVRGARGR